MAAQYITMNRFKIKPEFADAYVKVWEAADVAEKSMPGLLEFRFLKLDAKKDYVLFSSYARWKTKEDFLAWTQSEHFRKSHSTGPKNREMYVERPELECFEVVI